MTRRYAYETWPCTRRLEDERTCPCAPCDGSGEPNRTEEAPQRFLALDRMCGAEVRHKIKTIAVHVNSPDATGPPLTRPSYLVQASRRKVVLVDAHRLLLQGRVDGLRSRASRRCPCRAGHSSCARAGATPPAFRDGALTAERWAVWSVGQASRRGPMA